MLPQRAAQAPKVKENLKLIAFKPTKPVDREPHLPRRDSKAKTPIKELDHLEIQSQATNDQLDHEANRRGLESTYSDQTKPPVESEGA
jgi:hypothetical protein